MRRLSRMVAAQKRAAKITPDQSARLGAFAGEHGPRWRDELERLWATGGDCKLVDGHLLRQVRNQIGPLGLAFLSATTCGKIIRRDLDGNCI